TPDLGLDQVRAVRASGTPIVLSPVYWVHDEVSWAEPALQGLFLENQKPELREQYLGALAKRILVVNNKPLMLGRESDTTYQTRQEELLRSVDRVLPNSLIEMRELSRNLGATDVPFTIVPNAVDPDVFANASPDWFVETYGLRDFICIAGRIDVRKNQLL